MKLELRFLLNHRWLACLFTSKELCSTLFWQLTLDRVYYAITQWHTHVVVSTSHLSHTVTHTCCSVYYSPITHSDTHMLQCLLVTYHTPVDVILNTHLLNICFNCLANELLRSIWLNIDSFEAKQQQNSKITRQLNAMSRTVDHIHLE